MTVLSRLNRLLQDEAGATLVEVVVAIALLTVGLLGIVSASAVQTGGAAAGVAFGQAAVSRANSLTTATLLAQARLEEVKNATYTASTDQLLAANFPDEAYGAVPAFPAYQRTVTIQDGVPGAGMKTVTVQVLFRPSAATGLGGEESVNLVTVIARRP